MRDFEHMRSAIFRTTAWGVGIAAVLAFVIAWRLRRSVVARIESINRTSRRIMEGELSERIRSHGSGDEFDELITNLNAMLERIESLMEDVRRVSDNVAHDLRTPLGRLRTRLERLRDAEGDGVSVELAEGGAGGSRSDARDLQRAASHRPDRDPAAPARLRAREPSPP